MRPVRTAVHHLHRGHRSHGRFDDRSSNAGATGTLEIDGRTVKHLEQHRFESTEFTLTLVSDNVIEGLPGTYTSAASVGIYVLLTPLGPGLHTIHYTGSNNSGVSLDVTYHLVVGC